MIAHNIFIPLDTKSFDSQLLKKGAWLALLHAQRVPPHAGLLFEGKYCSLTIKEAELNIDSALLLETIARKKIKTIFIRIIAHPVFSLDHQRDIFAEDLKKHGFVEQGRATCLSPIKSFFRDFYAMEAGEEVLLFDFITRLNENNYLQFAMATNMELYAGIELPLYNQEDLNDRIRSERQIYFTH